MPPSAASASAAAAVRVSCHVIDLATGCPVRRSQTSTLTFVRDSDPRHVRRRGARRRFFVSGSSPLRCCTSLGEQVASPRDELLDGLRGSAGDFLDRGSHAVIPILAM